MKCWISPRLEEWLDHAIPLAIPRVVRLHDWRLGAAFYALVLGASFVFLYRNCFLHGV